MNHNPEYITYDLIAAFLDEQISPEDAAILQQWIDSSEENRKYFEECRILWTEAGKLDPPPVAVDVDNAWLALSTRIESYEKTNLHKPAQKKTIIFRKQYIFRIAASIMILLASLLTYNILKKQLSNNILEVFSSESLKNETLTDGTKVTLNAYTRIEYPKKFKSSKREVTLISGEAFFNVSHDAEKPFIVYTDNTIIRVLGTKFNVRSLAGQPEIEVFVESGRVMLSAVHPQLKDTASITVEAGESATYNKITYELQKGSQTEPNNLFWLDQTMIFNRTPLPDVISTIENNYGVTVRLKKEEYNSLRLSSVFKNQPLDTVLQIIGTTFDLQLAKEGEIYVFN